MDSLANSLSEAPATPDEVSAAVRTSTRDLLRWQRRLLPFMTGFIVAMAVLFFCFSGLHLYQVSGFIETEHGQNIRTLIESEISKPTGDKLTSAEVLQHSLLLLEADALDKRYHQASALLLSRIWSRQLAFITGMVLAFVGSIFILGKLSENTSNISGGYAEWKVAISSASPGIILSLFGTVLLVTSLFVRASLDVADGPAYLNVLHRPAASASPAAVPAADGTQPLDLNDLEKLGTQKDSSAPGQAQK
jgi:hypothetical protein